MEVVGFMLAVVIGTLLSLLGGGGSILTVPVLVYLFLIPPQIATAYSLLIVGISSLAGSLYYLKNGNASIKTALYFSFPSFIMVFLMRKYIMPIIPQIILQSDTFIIDKRMLIMTAFAFLMIIASYSMIMGRKKLTENIIAIKRRINYPLIFLEGLVVGSLTGFVGVGGGFLIIPVLTLFVKLPIKMAVGTSLMIIAINSCMGFLGDLGSVTMDWSFLYKFISLSLVGVFIGNYLSRHINNSLLKPFFGWFILAMGIAILLKEFWPI